MTDTDTTPVRVVTLDRPIDSSATLDEIDALTHEQSALLTLTDRVGSETCHAPYEAWFGLDDFLPGNTQMIGSGVDRLDEIGDAIIAAYQELYYLRDVRIIYTWRKRATTNMGIPNIGECKKLTGLTKYHAKAEWEIVIAADEAQSLTNRQLEAAMYAELLHIEERENAEGETRLVMRPHQFSGFYDEIKRYGLWRVDLQNAHAGFQQLGLPVESETTDVRREADDD